MLIEIAIIKIEKDITPQKIITRGLTEDITSFLQLPNRLSSKKRRPINKNKKKTSIGETSLRKAIISSLNNFNKELLLMPIPEIKKLSPKTENINIDMIGANAYCAAYCLKRAQVFAISIKNIQYQAKKKTRIETDLKSVVLKKYHNFFNIFLKKKSDTFFPY